jgi:hypothetical protein
VIETTARTALAVLILAGLGGSARGAEEETEIYAAAIRYVARATGCTKKAPCCFSVAGKVPSQELAKLLSATAVKPTRESAACVEMTLDARRVSGADSRYQYVEVAAGVGSSSLSGCTYALRRKSKGFDVVPSETACSF